MPASSLLPETYDLSVDGFDAGQLSAGPGEMRKAVADTVAATRTHGEFIEQYARPSPSRPSRNNPDGSPEQDRHRRRRLGRLDLRGHAQPLFPERPDAGRADRVRGDRHDRRGGIDHSAVPPADPHPGDQRAGIHQETQAAFKLGIRFENWLEKGDVYYHPFGQIGGPLEVNEFYQCWLRAKQNGHPSSLQDFAPATVMADTGKFMLPAKAQRTMIANANYALHVDARLVALYLRKFAEARGVKRTEGIVTDVATRPDGGVQKVILKDGREVAGDFFIDCSGFRALLIGKTLGEPFRDWGDVLLCDRAVAAQTENVGAPHPYTLVQAQDFGWRWRIPLQHRSGNGYVFASKYLSDDEATATLMSQVQGEVVLGPAVIPFKTGVRERPWVKNVVSIGLSCGFIEPLESTALHLIYKGMDYLLRFMPDMDADRPWRPSTTAAWSPTTRRSATSSSCTT
jgi:hypothetical protein